MVAVLVLLVVKIMGWQGCIDGGGTIGVDGIAGGGTIGCWCYCG